MGDYANAAAAILGGALGLFVALRLNLFRGRGEERDPVSAELSRPTGYFSTHSPSAAPILAALGVTLLGVGLVVGSSVEVFGAVLVIPGVLLLIAAFVTAIRRRSSPPPP